MRKLLHIIISIMVFGCAHTQTQPGKVDNFLQPIMASEYAESLSNETYIKYLTKTSIKSGTDTLNLSREDEGFYPSNTIREVMIKSLLSNNYKINSDKLNTSKRLLSNYINDYLSLQIGVKYNKDNIAIFNNPKVASLSLISSLANRGSTILYVGEYDYNLQKQAELIGANIDFITLEELYVHENKIAKYNALIIAEDKEFDSHSLEKIIDLAEKYIANSNRSLVIDRRNNLELTKHTNSIISENISKRLRVKTIILADTREVTMADVVGAYVVAPSQFIKKLEYISEVISPLTSANVDALVVDKLHNFNSRINKSKTLELNKKIATEIIPSTLIHHEDEEKDRDYIKLDISPLFGRPIPAPIANRLEKSEFSDIYDILEYFSALKLVGMSKNLILAPAGSKYIKMSLATNTEDVKAAATLIRQAFNLL